MEQTGFEEFTKWLKNNETAFMIPRDVAMELYYHARRMIMAMTQAELVPIAKDTSICPFCKKEIDAHGRGHLNSGRGRCLRQVHIKVLPPDDLSDF